MHPHDDVWMPDDCKTCACVNGEVLCKSDCLLINCPAVSNGRAFCAQSNYCNNLFYLRKCLHFETMYNLSLLIPVFPRLGHNRKVDQHTLSLYFHQKSFNVYHSRTQTGPVHPFFRAMHLSSRKAYAVQFAVKCLSPIAVACSTRCALYQMHKAVWLTMST